MRLDDPAPDADGSVPKPIRRIPSEVIVRNRVREAPVRMHLVLEYIMDSLTIERSIREVGPNDELIIGNVGGSRVSQSPLAAVNDLRSIWKTSMPEEEPFFPTGSVLVDIERIDADLGLEEGGGRGAVGEGKMVVARAVVVHGGGGW